jgi:hypothetical protein
VVAVVRVGVDRTAQGLVLRDRVVCGVVVVEVDCDVGVGAIILDVVIVFSVCFVEIVGVVAVVFVRCDFQWAELVGVWLIAA